MYSRNVRSRATGEYIHMSLAADVTGISAGTTTIGVTCVRALGTGTIDIRGASDNTRFLIVEDIGR